MESHTVIPALGRERQMDKKVNIILCYVMN